MMTTNLEEYVRWEPLSGLPEHPCGELVVAYEGDKLSTSIFYAFDPPVRGLRINFGAVEAFKAYEEFADPWMEERLIQPMINNRELNKWTWPLQIVRNSRWIDRLTSRNQLREYDWRHFHIATSDKSLHVAMTGWPEKVELIY